MNTFLGEYNSLKSTPEQVENKNRPVSTKKEVRNLSVCYSVKKQNTQNFTGTFYQPFKLILLRGKKENL